MNDFYYDMYINVTFLLQCKQQIGKTLVFERPDTRKLPLNLIRDKGIQLILLVKEFLQCVFTNISLNVFDSCFEVAKITTAIVLQPHLNIWYLNVSTCWIYIFL